MMLSEFVERTGFEPLPFEYEKIEEAYYNFDGDKDAFCKAFVEDDGEWKIYQARAAEIDRLNGRILEMDKAAKKDGEEYERRLAFFQVELDKEQAFYLVSSSTALTASRSSSSVLHLSISSSTIRRMYSVLVAISSMSSLLP